MSLSVTLSEVNGVSVLTLSGRVIAQGSLELRGQLEQLVTKEGELKAIDITDVDFIDSHALGLILYYCANGSNKKYRVFIINTSQTGESYIDKLIKLTDLHQTVTIVNDCFAIEGAKGG